MNNKINFNYFTGSALFAFVRALLKFVDSTKLPDGLLKTLLVKLETIYNDFSKGFERDANDPLTMEAAKRDAQRDKYYGGMKNYIRSFLKSPLAAKVTAAEKLVAVIRKYGWLAETYSYDDETTAISKCLEEMTTTYSAEITELGVADMWINPLNEAQMAFEEVQNQRIANGASDVPAVSKFRVPLQKALRKFIGTLDTYAENSDDAALKAYAAEIDELIGRTMANLKSSANRSENNSSPEAPANE